MKSIRYLLIILSSCILGSCIVHAPKYTGIEEVLQLKPGMTKEEVSQTLGIPPYDLKSVNDSATVYIYKYRTTDRKTVPLAMNKTNGMKAKGKWVDLFISYGLDGKAKSITSCSDCEATDIKERKIDINSIIMLLTITIPSVMVYFGLKTP